MYPEVCRPRRRPHPAVTRTAIYVTGALFADGCVRGRNRTRLRWQQRISPDTAKSRGPDNVDTCAYLLGTVIAAVYFQEKAVTPVQGALRRRLTRGTDLFPVKVAA